MIRRSGCGCVLIFVLQAAAYSPALLRLVKPSHSYLAARAPAVAMHDSADLPAKGRRRRAKATDADAKDAGRNEGEAPIAWYLRNIGNHELLTSEEELELSTLVQRMLAVRAKGTQMEEDLGRPPTQSELAAALSLGTPPPRCLRRRRHHPPSASGLQPLSQGPFRNSRPCLQGPNSSMLLALPRRSSTCALRRPSPHAVPHPNQLTLTSSP